MCQRDGSEREKQYPGTLRWDGATGHPPLGDVGQREPELRPSTSFPPVFGETPFCTFLRMNRRAPKVNPVSQHNIQCLDCCPPLQARGLMRKRLSKAWALSVIHIPFSEVCKCTEKNSNTLLVIFTLHARTYIKIHTQTQTRCLFGSHKNR